MFDRGMVEVVLYALLAGATIPIGAALASRSSLHKGWLESEVRHAVIGFGAGAMLAAVSFVLVPNAIAHVVHVEAAVFFFAGGVAFLFLDMVLSHIGGRFPQLFCMLADFIPESIALGAAFATQAPGAHLLAILIAAQNLPEGFNAFREIVKSHPRSRSSLTFVFMLLVPLGPIAAVFGMMRLSQDPVLLARLELAAAGGILYLMFQDIAPTVPLRRHWWPSLGALGGFFVGILGMMLLHA